MTDYSSAVADYLRTRRAMGYKLTEDGRLLRQFAAYLDAVGADYLSVTHALSWATQPTDGVSDHVKRLWRTFGGPVAGWSGSSPLRRCATRSCPTSCFRTCPVSV